MTPKQAIEFFEQVRVNYFDFIEKNLDGLKIEDLAIVGIYDDALAALTHHLIPRTTPPTLEEVGDMDKCWLLVGDKWQIWQGKIARDIWRDGDKWLPLPEEGE
jgi:hypothetical protein